MASHPSVKMGTALLLCGFVAASACGGRDQLSFGPGADGSGGEDPVGPGSGGAGQGGFVATGGVGPTTTVGAGGVGPVTTVGAGGVGPSSSGVGGGPVTVTVGAGGFGPTSTTTVTTVTTSGAGGMGPVTTVGAGGFGGFPMTSGGGSNPVDCFTCIAGNCPQAAACFQNPACLQGTICAVSQCLGGGPPNFGCVLNCFNGDFMAAIQALQAVGCVFSQCGQQCQGLLGGP